MPPLTAADLDAALAEADAETVAGFLADLHAARGRSVERLDGPAFALGAERERVVVPDGDVPAAADVVVVAGRSGLDPEEARAVDADDIAEALLYAVPRETTDRLLRTWLDRPLDAFEGGDGTQAVDGERGNGGPTRGRETTVARTAADDARRGITVASSGNEGGDTGAATASGDHGRTPGRRHPAGRPLAWGAVVAAVVALALVAAGAGVVPGVGGLDDAGGAGPGEDAVDPAARTPGEGPAAEQDGQAPGAAPGVDPQAYGRADATGAAVNGSVNVAARALPPGVDGNGSIDERRLLAAHRALLSNQSYRVTLTYREFVGDRETGTVVQTVRVGGDGRYRAATTRLGTTQARPPTLADGDRYADGTTRYERTAEGVARSPVDVRDPFLDDVVRYLRWYLSVEESRLTGAATRDGETVVGLVTDGDPYPGVVNASGSAVVTSAGLVRQVRRAYDDPDTGVRVVVTIRVTDVGRTNVTAPRWVSEGCTEEERSSSADCR